MESVLESEKGECFYDIVGCSITATKEQITAEYRHLAKQYHPDKNKEDQEKFQRISEAYNVLSDGTKRKDYDKWKNSGLCISYKDWKKLSKASHTSLHWQSSIHKQLAVTDAESLDDDQNKSSLSIHHKRSSQTGYGLRSKFRRYEI